MTNKTEDKMTASKNFTYGIYRLGRNSANQPRHCKELVCSVEAPNRDLAVAEALRLEREGRFTRYNNQFLSAVPWSKVPQEDAEELAQQEQLVSDTCVLCGTSIGHVAAWSAGNNLCAKCQKKI